MAEFDIFYANNSAGLLVDARELAQALGAAGHSARAVAIPYDIFLNGLEVNAARYALPQAEPGRAAVFLESLFEHPALDHYARKIFVPNPECFVERDFPKTKMLTEFWHKTHFSMNVLSQRFESSAHVRIGFSSTALGRTVSDYGRFVHFRGKSSHRHTKEILEIWNSRPDLPPIAAQAYGPDIGLETGRWLEGGNLRLYLGQMPRGEYEDELARGGIHLCLSQHEGFGHYINEARSMGALVVTLDAPPMNELITPESGVLVPASAGVRLHGGFSFAATRGDIERAINDVLALPLELRRARGDAARHAYHADRKSFTDAVARAA